MVITDSDIDEIEAQFGDVKFDTCRRDVIKCLDSIDVQAMPGTGKTTVLIAKLAILAKKWTYRNSGICVLSHTNIAKEEIQYRLGKTEIGGKLFSYPHFIGTLQSFFDTYVSIPWLRSNGYPITMIEQEFVLKRRWDMLDYRTRNFLKYKRRGEEACESIGFPVSVNLSCSETSESYQKVKSVIEKSQRDGYFTYQEMWSIAKYALENNKIIGESLQARFPIIFIDEAQDTSDSQWDTIDKIFSTSSFSIMQALGDANQAIFNSYEGRQSETKFPSQKTIMTINNSFRFGEGIANLADPLGVVRKGLTGKCDLYNSLARKHTIFLFNKVDTVKLIQAYAKKILECFTDEELDQNSRLGCYVVGMVHTKDLESSQSTRFPAGLKDYLPTYNPEIGKILPSPSYLIDYFRLGQNVFSKADDNYEHLDFISNGLRKIINAMTPSEKLIRTNGFAGLISSIPVNKQHTFRKEMLSLLQMPFSNEEEWETLVGKCKELWLQFFNIVVSSSDFLKYTNIGQSGEARREPNENIYSYLDEETGRSINIRFGSIHSVKGKSNLATMVVETFWYDPNIKSIIPWLCNQGGTSLKTRDKIRLKCHYVALTRARGLICIGMPVESLTPQEQRMLRSIGWNIEML